jgi:hypothetical protein
VGGEGGTVVGLSAWWESRGGGVAVEPRNTKGGENEHVKSKYYKNCKNENEKTGAPEP